MEYKLTRSQRKTITILINRDGDLEVRAPLHTPRAEILRLLEKQQDWVARTQLQAKERARLRREFKLEIGSLVPLLGREYAVLSGVTPHFDGAAFFVNPEGEIQPQVEGIYRSLAKEYLGSRMKLFAEQMGVVPASLCITGAATRFGSCSGRNGICFTWKILLAPPELVDYVVVHELCHIRQHNHSERFWAEVEQVLPDYRKRKEGLKEFGRRLQEQNW